MANILHNLSIIKFLTASDFAECVTLNTSDLSDIITLNLIDLDCRIRPDPDPLEFLMKHNSIQDIREIPMDIITKISTLLITNNRKAV